MSVESHLAQLERKHQAVDQALASETSHPNQDAIKVATLKRKKLFLKDEIAKLKEMGKHRTGLH